MLADRPVSSITLHDLTKLVDESQREGLRIEFKRDQYEWNDAGTREFLADVASFANAQGGILLIGIDEVDGCASALVGIEAEADGEVQRIVEKIKSGIEPRISGIEVGVVALEPSRRIIIVRVPRSWSRPHMVTFKNYSRFFARTSSGKYQLDVHELRAAFIGSEALADRLRTFRLERVADIQADVTPVILERGAKLVLHAVPFSALDTGAGVEIPSLDEINMLMRPISSAGWSWRHNLDGLLTYTNPNHPEASTYVQVFRRGMIEAVDCRLLREFDGQLAIPSIKFEEELLGVTARFGQLVGRIGLAEPIAWMLTLVGVRDYFMAIGARAGFGVAARIDRDVVLVPEVLQTTAEMPNAEVVRRLVDPVWQACGYEKSHNFSSDGSWQPQQRW